MRGKLTAKPGTKHKLPPCPSELLDGPLNTGHFCKYLDSSGSRNSWGEKGNTSPFHPHWADLLPCPAWPTKEQMEGTLRRVRASSGGLLRGYPGAAPTPRSLQDGRRLAALSSGSPGEGRLASGLNGVMS